MLKVYRGDVVVEDGRKRRRRSSPRVRRRRGGGFGVSAGLEAAVDGVPGERDSKSVNRETELAGLGRLSVEGVFSNRNCYDKKKDKVPICLALGALSVSTAKTLYTGIFYKCISCVMGMFKWLRKDFVQWDRSRRNNLASPERRGLNNDPQDRRQTLTVFFEREPPGRRRFSPEIELTEEIIPEETSASRNDRASSEAYRSALQAFLERRREPGEGSEASQSPNSSPAAGGNNRIDIFNKNIINSDKRSEERQIVPGVPHVEASEVFEVGWVAGTEDRYLELIAAEWQHTRTALRRSSHPDCFTAVRADLDVLTEIRHPNTLLLMGTTRTDEHGIVAIFESVDCTLYNYVHEQGERVSVQGAARCAGQIADALRHAHARGIIHGAISSHCIFLAASGSAKLGGWELAVRENEPRPYRDWEERLRTEIYRWQAPEMFYGDSPSRACDVYALVLLIWEMCTGRIPWSGLTEAEIERQYIHWERGVATDSYNFPPLLGNLLESGLQLDPNKRKLDMNRTRRFLRRIELRYEDEEPTFVDRQSNNNNPNIKTFNAPVATSPIIKSPASTPKRDSIDINNSLMIGKKLFNSERSGKKYSNTDKKIEKYDEFDKKNVISSNANIYSETVVVKNSTITAPKGNESLESNEETLKRDKKVVYSGGKRQLRSVKDNSNDFNEGAKRNEKNLVAYDNSFSGTSTTPAETPSSSGDESANDTITDLKKLKEIIAAKRSNFFYGNSPPVNQEVSSASNDESDTRSSPRLREKILEEARSKNCEPCKPASHKVNVEPQVCKSPSEYDPTLIKPASHQNQRTMILQSQTTNQNSASFFESSLWRKEKLICLSKMRKGNPNEEKDLSGICDKDILAKTNDDSPGSDSTYVIDDDNKPVEKVNRDFGDTEILNNAEECTSPMTPLQALKEALDRATDIINSGTQSVENSIESSPIKGVNNVDIIFDESEANESIFQMINRSKLCNNDPDGEIKSIERSTNGDRDSLLSLGKSFDTAAEEPLPSSLEKYKSRCVSFGKTTRDGKEDSQISTIDTSLIKILHDFTCDDFSVDPDDSLNQLAERSLISTAMVFLSGKSQEKGCKSCQHRNLLARRRSLPAGLGQFRSVGNASPLGRLPIRKADVPDSTVEDLYIDDEFGDNLNINMVLLEGEDEPDERDLLSSLLHSPEA